MGEHKSPYLLTYLLTGSEMKHCNKTARYTEKLISDKNENVITLVICALL